MKQYKVIQVKDMRQLELSHLLSESREEGFRFLDRLVDDFQQGTNTFNGTEEALFAVVNSESVTLAIGGVNIDPFLDDPSIGRVRRFYVYSKHRRSGLGKLLLDRIKIHATGHFKYLVLNSSEQAERFYDSCGFIKTEQFTGATHILNL
jgi:GNAT superfamily N-acetyltransferase